MLSCDDKKKWQKTSMHALSSIISKYLIILIVMPQVKLAKETVTKQLYRFEMLQSLISMQETHSDRHVVFRLSI